MPASVSPARFGLTLAVLVAAGLTLAGRGDTYSWNQKMTVTVETPAGKVSGSSIVHIERTFFDPNEQFISANATQGRIQGEAVVVELATGRYLFALVGGNTHQVAYAAFGRDRDKSWPEGREKPEQIAARLDNWRGSRVLPRDLYPTLVTFTSIDAPRTVKRVDPGNLAATFGSGYRLHSVTLEITDEPVTEGRVAEIVRWYRDGEEIPDDFWRNVLTSEQQSLLSSVNWIKD